MSDTHDRQEDICFMLLNDEYNLIKVQQERTSSKFKFQSIVSFQDKDGFEETI